MKIVRLMTLAIALSFMVGACGGSPMGKMSSLVDKMCKCDDQACLKKVGEEMSGLRKKYPDYKPSESDKPKYKELKKKMRGCMKDVVTKTMKKGGK